MNLSSLDPLGYTLLPTIFPPDILTHLFPLADEALRASTARAGARIPTDADLIQRILAHAPFANAIASRAPYHPVRAIVFDKSPDHNWGVPWHRDTTIAVRDKHPTPGFAPWSIKDTVHHVQPPPAVLRAMLTARIHLDPTPATNGALQVIPGSHNDISDDWPDADPGRMGRDLITLEANAGDVVLMNPLTLHASSKSTQPARRRVVHIEFAKQPLPEPLAWHSEP